MQTNSKGQRAPRNVKRSKAGYNIVPLDVEQFGWVKDSTNKTVDPVFLDSTTPIAPDSLLKVTFCG